MQCNSSTTGNLVTNKESNNLRTTLFHGFCFTSFTMQCHYVFYLAMVCQEYPLKLKLLHIFVVISARKFNIGTQTLTLRVIRTGQGLNMASCCGNDCEPQIKNRSHILTQWVRHHWHSPLSITWHLKCIEIVVILLKIVILRDKLAVLWSQNSWRRRFNHSHISDIQTLPATNCCSLLEVMLARSASFCLQAASLSYQFR